MKRVKKMTGSWNLIKEEKINSRIVLFFVTLMLLFPGNSKAQNNASSFGLYFSVDYQDSLGLYRDEPAILSISISNPAAAYAKTWNKEALSYLSDLEKKFNDGKMSEEVYQQERKSVTEGMLGTYESRIGTPAEPWVSKVKFNIYTEKREEVASLSLRLLNSSKPAAVAVLNERTYYSAEYNLPPNALQQLSSGSYRFTVSIDDIESAPVRLKYKAEAMPDFFKNKETTLLKIGQYYLQDEDPGKAIEYAEQILSRNANTLDGLVLRGDSYLFMENYNKALVDYERALKLFYQEFPDSYEAPEYLLDMIEYASGKN